eukprot:1576654-Amphidinium_carterae.1
MFFGPATTHPCTIHSCRRPPQQQSYFFNLSHIRAHQDWECKTASNTDIAKMKAKASAQDDRVLAHLPFLLQARPVVQLGVLGHFVPLLIKDVYPRIGQVAPNADADE